MVRAYLRRSTATWDMTARNHELIEKLEALPRGDDGSAAMTNELLTESIKGLTHPSKQADAALAKLRETHREEFDFYLEHAKTHGIEEWKELPDPPISLKAFSLADYLEAALACAEYEQDEDGLIVASVPGAVGCYSQGESHEEARTNLLDAIEGSVIFALQMGWEIPQIQGFEIRTEVVQTDPA